MRKGFQPGCVRVFVASRCSSVVEHFLGKEGVTSSTLVNGSETFLIADDLTEKMIRVGN